MKYLIIAIILGGLGYYMFVYDSKPQVTQENKTITENQKLEEEFGIENTSYQGAITQTYQSMKDAVQGAKDAVSATEERY